MELGVVVVPVVVASTVTELDPVVAAWAPSNTQNLCATSPVASASSGPHLQLCCRGDPVVRRVNGCCEMFITSLRLSLRSSNPSFN